MGLTTTVLNAIRGWSHDHPRVKIYLREGWGLSRETAARLRFRAPFEPPEFDDLRRLRDSAAKTHPKSNTHHVLFLSMRGWSTNAVIETVLAHAVVQHGAEVTFATCAGRLPICDAVSINSGLHMPCHSCGGYATDAIRAAGFPYLRVNDLVDIKQVVREIRPRVKVLSTLDECLDFCDGEMPVGALVKTSVAWFLSKGTLDDGAETLNVFRRFLISGAVVHRAFTVLLDRTVPDRVLLLNGLFFAERILCDIATHRAIPITRYEGGFRENTLVVSRWNPKADDLDVSDAEWENTRGTPLSAENLRVIEDYMLQRSRAVGHPTLRAEAVREALSLRGNRPMAVLFTNILWDSAILGKDVAFKSMPLWLVAAVDWARRLPAIELVIRIHPHELNGGHKSREIMSDVLKSLVTQMPENVHVVPPEVPVDSYALMDLARVGLVYTSTTGLEMAVRGKPVIVAGDAHYAKRGFTLDPSEPEDYWSAAERAVTEGADGRRDERRELALRYAYLFFFRFHQDLGVVRQQGPSQPRVVARTVRDLQPGSNPTLDRIVEAIFEGSGAVVSPLDVH